MGYLGIAAKAGTTSANIKKFIRTGDCSPGFANTIGTTTTNIKAFVNGKASPGLAQTLGTNTSSAQGLREEIGRVGAIGLIIGLACGRGKDNK